MPKDLTYTNRMELYQVKVRKRLYQFQEIHLIISNKGQTLCEKD